MKLSINGWISHLSSISIGFSNINHQFWGTPIYGNPQSCAFMTTACTGAIKSIQILISVCVDRCSLPGTMHNRLLYISEFIYSTGACRSGQVQNVQSCPKLSKCSTTSSAALHFSMAVSMDSLSDRSSPQMSDGNAWPAWLQNAPTMYHRREMAVCQNPGTPGEHQNSW